MKIRQKHKNNRHSKYVKKDTKRERYAKRRQTIRIAI